MSVTDVLQSQRDQARLTAAISNWIFDQLQKPIPAELDVRFKYPKCPFCKRRPELVKARGGELSIEARPGSGSVIIPRYEVLTCCSANYTVQHDKPSQAVLKRVAYEKRRGLTGGKHG